MITLLYDLCPPSHRAMYLLNFIRTTLQAVLKYMYLAPILHPISIKVLPNVLPTAWYGMDLEITMVLILCTY